jgi:hypothetical protein
LKELSECRDNTDSDCYCLNTELTKSVIDCVNAHKKDNAEAAAAMQHFAGICAPHLGENPVPINYVPPTLTVAPPAAASTAPVTVITVSATQVVPVTYSTGQSQGLTIPSSSTTVTVSTVATVPQVGFSTYSTGTTPEAGLVVGTPAPAPASTVANVPAATTAVSPSGYGAATPSGPAAATSPIALSNSGSGLVTPGMAGVGAIIMAMLAL